MKVINYAALHLYYSDLSYLYQKLTINYVIPIIIRVENESEFDEII